MIISDSILAKVAETIAEYDLISKDEPIAVALSGGKDSIFTVLALKQLGYRVSAITIDLGYEANWGNKIQELAQALDFSTHIIETRSSAFRRQLPNETRIGLENFFVRLDEIGSEFQSVTPCTFCYNIKILALANHMRTIGIEKLAFGHHGTDAIASFLKSALMYLDRWHFSHKQFIKSNFEKLIENLKADFLVGYEHLARTEIFNNLNNLITMKVVGTDEPPRQYVNTQQYKINIIRPLFNLTEVDITNYIRLHSIKTEGSGCGHGAIAATQTPREMIHYRILRPMLELTSGNNTHGRLLELINKSLFADGTLEVNVRNERENILGAEYRFGSSAKL